MVAILREVRPHLWDDTALDLLRNQSPKIPNVTGGVETLAVAAGRGMRHGLAELHLVRLGIAISQGWAVRDPI